MQGGLLEFQPGYQKKPTEFWLQKQGNYNEL